MTEVHLASVVGEAEGSARGKAGALVLARPGGIKWTKKTIIIRNAPWTVWHPHIRQAAMRYLFGLVGSYTKGVKGTTTLPEDGHRIPAGTTVPKPTAIVQVALKRQVDRYLSGFPKHEGKPKYHVHGVGQLENEIRSKNFTPPSVSKDSVLKLALDKKIISDEEYKRLSGGGT